MSSRRDTLMKPRSFSQPEKNSTNVEHTVTENTSRRVRHSSCHDSSFASNSIDARSPVEKCRSASLPMSLPVQHLVLARSMVSTSNRAPYVNSTMLSVASASNLVLASGSAFALATGGVEACHKRQSRAPPLLRRPRRCVALPLAVKRLERDEELFHARTGRQSTAARDSRTLYVGAARARRHTRAPKSAACARRRRRGGRRADPAQCSRAHAPGARRR
jgi:hypothetical protein